MSTIVLRLLLAALLAVLPVSFDATGEGGAPLKPALALADDDDDDDGGGGGGGGGANRGDRGGGSRSEAGRSSGPGVLELWFGRPRASAPRRAARERPAPRRPAPEIAVANEIVVLGLDDGELDRLEAEGFVRLDEGLAGGQRLLRLRVPRTVRVDRALARVAEIAPRSLSDRNHLYRPQAADGCAAEICSSWRQVGWHERGDRSCLAGVTVGVVDTGVNDEHDALRQAEVRLVTVRAKGARPSSARHGTAVMSLLAGDPASRIPGLIPGAKLIAADPFVNAGGEDRADAFGLVQAIEALHGAGARILNLSLAGADNRILGHRIAALAAARVVVVAAVGNAGPRSKPLYPAAYDTVIGVTAVDGAGRIYRRAVRGAHVDIAAPGVGLPVAASVRGLRPQTGTSFAAPFVTAAAAVLVGAEPHLSPAEVAARLAAGAADLGDAGPDPVFGAGLLRADGACPRPRDSDGLPASPPPSVSLPDALATAPPTVRIP